MEDVIIIGGGPCGLSAAIECERLGLSAVIVEKYNIVQSIYLYPTHMQFLAQRNCSRSEMSRSVRQMTNLFATRHSPIIAK